VFNLDFLARTTEGLLQTIVGGLSWQILMFGAVFFATLGGAIALRPRRSMADRVVGQDTRAAPARRVSLRQEQPDTRLQRALKLIEQRIATDERERSLNRRRMIHAGYSGDTALRVYYVVRVLLAVALPTTFLISAPLLFSTMSAQTTAMVAAGLCLAGLYLPYRWVESKIEKRRTALVEGFPDALDMLVVCVEAGLSLDASLIRVGDQIAEAHPVVAFELRYVALELRAGKTREQALTNLGARSGVDDIANFAAVLIQSDALGADLSQALHVQSDEMRSKRMLRAEETAAKLPVKLSIPLILFVMPALLAAVAGPAIVAVARNLLPGLSH
jgi:tight adherence protein C